MFKSLFLLIALTLLFQGCAQKAYRSSSGGDVVSNGLTPQDQTVDEDMVCPESCTCKNNKKSCKR